MSSEFAEIMQNILEENKNNENYENLINQMKVDGIIDKDNNIIKSAIQRIFNNIF